MSVPTQRGEDIELNRRQQRLYTFRCDLWAAERYIDPGTGTVTENKPRRVGIDIPCLYEYTANVDDVTEVGRIKRDILDTTDRINFPEAVLLSNDYWVVNRSLRADGSPASTFGDVHRIVGAPQQIPRFATQRVNATQEEKPPAFLLEFLNPSPE